MSQKINFRVLRHFDATCGGCGWTGAVTAASLIGARLDATAAHNENVKRKLLCPCNIKIRENEEK
jgi:hypothetical protein